MRPRKRQGGQAMVEYAVVTGALIAALLANVYSSREGKGQVNAVDKLEEAYRLNYQGYSYAISLSQLPSYAAEAKWNHLKDQAKSALSEFQRFTDPSKMGLKTNLPKPKLCKDWSSFPVSCL